MTFGIEDLLKKFEQEERIYRMRCVEGWSMVIPWLGFPLAALLKEVEPPRRRKYVRFETLYDPRADAGPARYDGIHWPYTEGLRLDEAMNDLTILSTGLYGKILLPQNGAPLRLVVPWKYGFKSIKSIVKIDLVEEEPNSLLDGARARRVRLLRQREPGSVASALVAGHASGASARRPGVAPCRSTAMPNKWRSCTPAWICGRITNEHRGRRV